MDTDIVIIGGGIAGSALAATLAAEGLGVLVLDRQVTYEDQVRGECLWPWGVAEAERLGFHEVLLAAAGGSHIEWLVDYMDGDDPAGAEKQPIPLSEMVDGVPGALNISHPLACRTLADTATGRGAELVTGVDSFRIDQGDRTEVHFTTKQGSERHVRCRLVIGADGRNSVVRQQMGVTLTKARATHLIAGLLVEGLDIDPARDLVGNGEDVYMIALPQALGRTRLYLVFRDDRRAFHGEQGARRLIDTAALSYLPQRWKWAQAVPAGPCRSFGGDDTWTDRPFNQNVVLIGDAAGYNDPLIGEGLGLALRDVRALSEALLDGSPWDATTFERYGAERAERLRRMRSVARLFARETIVFGEQARDFRAGIQNRIQDDPTLLDAALAIFLGPEGMNPEVATDDFQRRYFDM